MYTFFYYFINTITLKNLKIFILHFKIIWINFKPFILTINEKSIHIVLPRYLVPRYNRYIYKLIGKLFK